MKIQSRLEPLALSMLHISFALPETNAQSLDILEPNYS